MPGRCVALLRRYAPGPFRPGKLSPSLGGHGIPRFLAALLPGPEGGSQKLTIDGGEWAYACASHSHGQTAAYERLIDYEVVILPLSSDGERVEVLMTRLVPDRSS